MPPNLVRAPNRPLRLLDCDHRFHPYCRRHTKPEPFVQFLCARFDGVVENAAHGHMFCGLRHAQHGIFEQAATNAAALDSAINGKGAARRSQFVRFNRSARAVTDVQDDDLLVRHGIKKQIRMPRDWNDADIRPLLEDAAASWKF